MGVAASRCPGEVDQPGMAVAATNCIQPKYTGKDLNKPVSSLFQQVKQF